MMLETKIHPLDTLPLSPSDRVFLEKTLDMLPDESVSDYDFEEVVSTPSGRKTYRYWEDARSTWPLSENPDWLHPIPSRQHVLDFMKEVSEWLTS